MNANKSTSERFRPDVSQLVSWLITKTKAVHVQPYTENYYKNQQTGSLQSAREVVPLVVELIRPTNVIDIGCGVGTWLSVFKECGIEDVWGVDGVYIDKKMLKIPAERFLTFDLKQPFHIDKEFDLVVSLEVAEHLPEQYAETFVESLASLGPVILFSAAIPFQGGTHHVNEQWQDYWAKHFQKKGYVVVDCVRKKIWQNNKVVWFYAQNILMYVREDYLNEHHAIKKEFENTNTSQISILHPKAVLNMSLRSMLSLLPIVMRKTLGRKVKRILSRKNIT